VPRVSSLPLAPPLARSGSAAAAFAVEPQRRHEPAGRTVAIVDDIMTTATSAAEVARVRKHAGASRVEVSVLAGTPRPEDA
jgi:predicted amidophosphoribosyltransferase